MDRFPMETCLSGGRFLKFLADDWEKELIETFAGYSHEEIDLERYRKKRQGEILTGNRGTCGQDRKFQARAGRDYEKKKWSKRHSSGFRKWLITVLLAISVLMTGYSVLKETGDVLLDQAKAWMEEGIDGARDEAGDDGDVASDKKCGGTSAAETPEDGFWGTEIPVYQGKA